MSDIKLGCHVGMAGKDMFLASAREAASYGVRMCCALHRGTTEHEKKGNL